MFLNVSDFEPRNILKVFLNTMCLTSPKNLKTIFQSWLTFYYIIKLRRGLYFVSMIQLLQLKAGLYFECQKECGRGQVYL